MLEITQETTSSTELLLEALYRTTRNIQILSVPFYCHACILKNVSWMCIILTNQIGVHIICTKDHMNYSSL